MTKVIDLILGIFVILVGLVMIVFSWLFYYQEETAIMQLASLYLALSISIIVCLIGVLIIIKRKEQDK